MTELKERKKYQSITGAIYVLTLGEYDRTHIVLVSPDVKLIAKKYAENYQESPSVEIWKQNKMIDSFSEYNNKTNQIIKLLSKKSKLEKEEYILPKNIIFVFSTGDYHRRTLDAVSSDVKLIAQLYAHNMTESPYVEIWKDGKFIHCLHEYTNNTNQIIKVLSMRARGIETLK